MDERRTAGSGTEAMDTSRGSAVSVRVCEQRSAAQRVLPESRFKLQHAGSPSEEAALEEADEKPGSWWPDWDLWMKRHSSGTVRAPAQLGNTNFHVIEAAPGRYVRQKSN